MSRFFIEWVADRASADWELEGAEAVKSQNLCGGLNFFQERRRRSVTLPDGGFETGPGTARLSEDVVKHSEIVARQKAARPVDTFIFVRLPQGQTAFETLLDLGQLGDVFGRIARDV